MTLSPIHAFFAQGSSGESSWWSWLAGFWFAVMFWLLFQFIIGVPMVITMAVIDESILQQMMASAETGPETIVSKILGTSLVLGPPLAIILFLARTNMDAGSKGRRNAMYIAALAALLSFAAFIHTLVTTPPEANEMINQFIPKSAAVYGFLLATFPPLVAGIWLSLKYIHKRGLKTVMTAHVKFRWGRLFFTMVVFWAVAGTLTFVAHSLGLNTVRGVFDPDKFWIYAVVSLLLIPLQSATEEIMLRGYMNQGLGQFVKNPWVVFVITSALFASLHLGNPEAHEGAANGTLIITMSSYFLFGMFACLLTYIDGGLESAIGMHAANNLYASIMLGYDNSALPTPTVFKTTLNSSTDLIFTILTLAIVAAILWKFKAPLTVDDPVKGVFEA